MSKEEEETTYLNDSHSEEECAMVAQDRPSSDDLDHSIVTFGHQTQRKTILRKHITIVSLNKKVLQKKICHTTIQEKQQMNLHILQNV